MIRPRCLLLQVGAVDPPQLPAPMTMTSYVARRLFPAGAAARRGSRRAGVAASSDVAPAAIKIGLQAGDLRNSCDRWSWIF